MPELDTAFKKPRAWGKVSQATKAPTQNSPTVATTKGMA